MEIKLLFSRKVKTNYLLLFLFLLSSIHGQNKDDYFFTPSNSALHLQDQHNISFDNALNTRQA